MLGWISKLWRLARSAEGGNFALITAIASPVVIISVALALQGIQTVRVHQQLNDAADAAVLAAVAQSSVVAVHGSQNTDALAAIGRKVFLAAASEIVSEKNTVVNVSVYPTPAGLKASLTYKATLDPGLNPFSNSPVTVEGFAFALGNLQKFINFYMALDVSQSMGIAATPDDIASLRALTFAATKGKETCEFACHVDPARDYWAIARNNHVNLRVDVLKSAVQEMLDAALASEANTQKYKVALYPFDVKLHELSPLSSDLQNIRSEASDIDITKVLPCCTQTDYTVSLTNLNNVIPKDGGDGTSAESPATFVFLITDGVADYLSDFHVESTSCVRGSYSTSGGYRHCTVCPKAPTLAVCEYHDLDVNTRNVEPINPALCQAFKDRNISVAVLYTKYLPIYGNDGYRALVKKWAVPKDQIAANLQACATGGLFFQATSGPEIQSALQAMFQASVNSVRLTE